MTAVFQSRKVVESYVESVLNGKRIAGKHQRYAVERYLADVGSAYSRGYYFDEEAAHKACNFAPIFCKHSIGAQFVGKPFILEPWQAFCVWNLFGWRKQSDSLRRFKKAYITVAAKSGKTTWAAYLAYMLTVFDSPVEASAHTFLTSTKLEQAKLVFDEVEKFVSSNPYVADTAQVYRSPPQRILFGDNKIQIIAIGGKLDGINAHAIIRDELHAFTESHREGCEKLISRMKARQQPLFIDITTAGSDKSLLWLEEDSYATQVAESVVSGSVIDDTYFPFICRMDVGDDPYDEHSWHKANPSLGVTIPVATIAEEANRAKNDASARQAFLRYTCNVQVSASCRAITPEQWQIGAKPLSRAMWREGYGGIDLARTRDFAAIGAVFPITDDNGNLLRWEVTSRVWVAREGGTRLDREPFRSWIANGKLSVIEGDRILFDELESEIVRWRDVYGVNKWRFDPYRAAEMMTRLAEIHGVAVEPFAQKTTTYNEPCTRFVDELVNGRIYHGGDEVLTWQAGNLEFFVDSGGLVKPDKGARDSKIDGMVAILMGFSGALFDQKQSADGSLFISG